MVPQRRSQWHAQACRTRRSLRARASARPRTRSASPEAVRVQRGHVAPRRRSSQRATTLVDGTPSYPAARPSARAAAGALSALEADIVARINAQRGARGLRPLRVSRGLTAAANYHSHQMGRSASSSTSPGTARRSGGGSSASIPSGRGYWSVGENIFWESPDTSGRERGARMDAEPAAPPEHPHARVARGRRRRRALRRGPGRLRRPVGHDRHRRLRRQTLGPAAHGLPCVPRRL